MEDINEILQEMKEEIEATLDSDKITNIRIVSRRRLIRCIISLRCVETKINNKIHESVQVKVPLEFTIESFPRCITMSIPRQPYITGTYWFNGRKVELMEDITIPLSEDNRLLNTFEFDISMFGAEGMCEKYFNHYFSISN